MVESWGTGRKDFSENVEYSTEPIIRSYQNTYTSYTEYEDVVPGVLTNVDITIPTETVLILYDFFLSSPVNVLLDFDCYAKSATSDVYVNIFRDKGYQTIYHPIPQGFPFFSTYRIRYRNNGERNIDLILTIAGLYTSEKNYYLSWQIAPETRLI